MPLKYNWALPDPKLDLESIARQRAANEVLAQIPDLANAPLEALLHAGVAEVLAGTIGGGGGGGNATQLQGRTVAVEAPANGDVLKFDGVEWKPGSDAVGGGMPEVTNIADRNALPSDPGQQVFVRGAGQVYRERSAGVWDLIVDRPLEWVNPKSFADAAWSPGTNSAAKVSAAEIAAHTEWRGRYVADVDTRDYVCLQEALYAAYASTTTSQGYIEWHGNANRMLNRPVWIPAGLWHINRPLRLCSAIGAKIFGAGRHTTHIFLTTKNESGLVIDGMAYSEIGGFSMQSTQGLNERAPVIDIDWAGSGTPIGGNVNFQIPGAGAGNTYAVVSADNPYLEKAGAGWTPDAFAGQWVTIVAGTGAGTFRKILSNTATRLYIDGDWVDANHPDATSEIVIGGVPGYINWSNANNSITSFLTNFASHGITPGVTQLTVINTVAKTKEVATISALVGQRQLTLAAPLADRPLPNPTSFGASSMGDNGQGRQGYQFVIGGTNHGLASGSGNWCRIKINRPGTVQNEFSCCYVEIYSGPGQGQVRLIRSHPAADGSGHVDLYLDSEQAQNAGFFDAGVCEQWWSTIPTAASTVRILPRAGHQVALQSNVFRDLYIEATSSVGIALARSGDLSMGSEHSFYDCFFNWCHVAGFKQYGANSLQNKFFGGNVASCPNGGIVAADGNLTVYDVGMQNNSASIPGLTEPIANVSYQTGYDVEFWQSASDRSVVDQCRSESLLLVRASNSHAVSMRNTKCIPSSASNVYTVGAVYHPGQYVLPNPRNGYLYRCVAISGDGVVGAQPSWPLSGTTTTVTTGAGAGGGTATFRRCDHVIVVTNYASVIDCGLPWGVISMQTPGVVIGTLVSRPDWFGTEAARFMTHHRINAMGVYVHLGGGQNLDGDGNVGTTLHTNGMAQAMGGAQVARWVNPVFLGSSPIVFSASSPGGDFGDIGLQMQRTTDTNRNFPLLAVVDADPSAEVAAVGKEARSGADAAGHDFRLAGGQGTGTGTGGSLRLQVAPASGVSSSTVNALADAVVLDSRKRTTFHGGVVAKAQTFTAQASVTPDAAAGEVVRASHNANITINNPTNAVDGARLFLDVKNDAAGAITVTLDTAFLGTFPAPASGKRRTQLYVYDATAAKWVPQGAQSGDL